MNKKEKLVKKYIQPTSTKKSLYFLEEKKFLYSTGI